MQEEYQNVEHGITLVDLFNMLMRNIFLIIAITVAFLIVGTIYTFRFVEPTYKSNADVFVQIDRTDEGGEKPTDYDITTTLRIIQSVSELFKKDVIIKETISDLNLDVSVGDFRKNLSVKFDSNSFFINVSYESTDPVLSRDVVNTIIDNTITYANENLGSLRNTIVPIGVAERGTYASPNKPLNIIISLLLGGIVGVGAALLLEATKTTVRNKKELELLIPEYKVIGIIPIIDDKEN
ncbi:MAG TPA: hypothetical protein GXZ48_04685 [Acholeplasmataceae bacterium]|nr:hypothetical protein [Acholeplasmataceae bacterium]